MNNPNPFVPQGSLLEQEKRRSRMKLAVFCVLAVGVCGLTAMLIQGCKRETENPDISQTNDQTNTPSLTDATNPPSTGIPTNPAPYIPTVPTNPVVPVPPVDISASSTSEYTVVAGDTLGKIAKAHGVSLKALEAANPGVDPKKLKPNKTKLVIPASTGGTVAPMTTDTTTVQDTGEQTYTVKSGDNLSKIARQYGVSVKAIQIENNLITTRITVGKKLKIPAKADAGAAAPVPVVAPAPATTLTTKPAH
jgi:LysM repeat protein